MNLNGMNKLTFASAVLGGLMAASGLIGSYLTQLGVGDVVTHRIVAGIGGLLLIVTILQEALDRRTTVAKQIGAQSIDLQRQQTVSAPNAITQRSIDVIPLAPLTQEEHSQWLSNQPSPSAQPVPATPSPGGSSSASSPPSASSSPSSSPSATSPPSGQPL